MRIITGTLAANDNGDRIGDMKKEAWRTVARRMRPELSDSQFEAMWAESLEVKRQMATQHMNAVRT